MFRWICRGCSSQQRLLFSSARKKKSVRDLCVREHLSYPVQSVGLIWMDISSSRISMLYALLDALRIRLFFRFAYQRRMSNLQRKNGWLSVVRTRVMRLSSSAPAAQIKGGGADDVRRAEEIQQAANAPVASLVEQTSLPELAALFRGAAVVIGGDTGPTHLSDALDVPTLMMMGSWPPTRNGLYRQPENVIEIERSCRRCMKRICPLGLDCLADITPDRVMARAENILAGVPAMREEWDGGRM